MPTATHIGELKIGDLRLPCAVLPGGRRVISQGGITTAFGPVAGGWQARKKAADDDHSGDMPPFLIAGSLKDFISNDLRTLVTSPVQYRDPRGGPLRIGFDATLIPQVCEVWLRARDAKSLTKNQLPVADRAELLMRSLAQIGIIALVDEATGFQSDRDKDELHRLLSIYLSEERLAWAKRFPDEFYKQIYRLKGWCWPVGRAKTPLLGHITNDVVYERLPPGVIGKLKELNPTLEETKRRKFKHHQFLSPDVGQPDLRDHILQILPLMKVSKDWPAFKKNIDTAFPRRGTQGEIDFDEEGDPVMD